MGQVIGSSDDKGAEPADDPVRPQDVLATVYRHLGINPSKHLFTLDGRPVPVLLKGKVIPQLL